MSDWHRQYGRVQGWGYRELPGNRSLSGGIRVGTAPGVVRRAPLTPWSSSSCAAASPISLLCRGIGPIAAIQPSLRRTVFPVHQMAAVREVLAGQGSSVAVRGRGAPLIAQI